jgi:hypothetical protein
MIIESSKMIDYIMIMSEIVSQQIVTLH